MQINFVTDDIEICSDDSDRETIDEEYLMKNIRYKNFFEKNVRTFLIIEVESSISQKTRNFCF